VLEVGAWNLATLSAGWLTPAVLATHQIALNYASLTYMVSLGIRRRGGERGTRVGAGDPGRARRAGWLALGLGAGFMLLAAVVFLAAPGPLIALYTRDPEVMALGRRLLWWWRPSRSFDGIQTVSTGLCGGWRDQGSHAGQPGGLLGAGMPLGLGFVLVLHRASSGCGSA